MTDSLIIPDLPAALRDLLRQIPSGYVTTYGDLAEALGDVGAARWVGEFLLHHEHDEACVCHRVIRKTGDAGLYITGDPQEKLARLATEGVHAAGSRIDLSRYGFREFQCDSPLKKLAALQRELPRRFRQELLSGLPKIVGAVDVSYVGTEAVAALAIVETKTGKLLDSFTVRQPVRFPYIPGYLSFRELPLLLAVVDAVPATATLPDVIFVDGNGILHHRGAGIATHFGILIDRPTIGVGKKLLCGSVNLDRLLPGESQPVIHNETVIGAAVKAGPKSRPIYVSPGHRMTVDDAVLLTLSSFHGHRLPEPIYHADRISRVVAKDNAT